MNGKGVERDLEQAYMWALLAAQNGNKSLKQALQYRITETQKQAAILRAEKMQAVIQAEELTKMQHL
jgi:TPR repeat protein